MKPFSPREPIALSQGQARRTVLVILAVWTILMGASLVWNLQLVQRHVHESALFQARALTDKDVLYRRWNNQFGGVYVKTSAGVEPNPFMAGHAERDIVTGDGALLTLVNPPFMTRQVYELQMEYLGIPGRITSLDPVNPGNQPDNWERAMLSRFDKGKDEGVANQAYQGRESLRYMQPLILEKGCLDCHDGTEKDIGAVRGALSIAIPMAPFWAAAQPRLASLAGTHMLIWIVGGFCMLWAYRRYSNALGLRLAAESDWRVAKEAAEQANLSKGEFLANVSHEIRTPLGSIIGMTDLLLEGPVSRDQRSSLISMKESADSLVRLINDILDFSKIEAGMLDFEEVPFCPAAEVENVLDILALKAHQKGLDLIHELPPDLPARVIGDPLRLRQVVMNLVDNAIKFTRRGEVRVTVVEGESTPGGRGALLRFCVSDTGIGIPRERIAGLFQDYQQGEPGTSRRYGGTGLGLAISQKLVQRMGGRIDVTSQPGKGSTFFFQVAFGWQAAAERRVDARGAFCGKKILAAIANPRERVALKQRLQPFGLHITETGDADEALAFCCRDQAEQADFDLIFIDEKLDGGGGLGLAERLPAACRSRTAALLNVDHLRNKIDRCRIAGLSHYLTKPLRSDRLTALMREILQGEPEAARHDLKSALPAPMGMTPAQILVVEDDDAHRKLIQSYLEKQGWFAVGVADGRQALRTLQSFACDLVLMDLHMPALDGLETARRIRSLPGRQSAVPIIGLSGRVGSDDRERCRAAGMDSHLAKPVRREALIEMVRTFLPENRLSAAADAAPADIEALVKELGSLEGAIDDLIRQFHIDSPRYAEELRQAIVSANGEQLARTAHRFKSLLGIFQARVAFQIADEMEKRGRGDQLDGVDHLADKLDSELVRIREFLDLNGS